MTSRMHLQPADILFSQNTDHTYFKKVKDNWHFSWIDHIYCCSATEIIDCKIKPDQMNKGDHHPLSAIIRILDNGKYQEKKRNTRKHNYWSDHKFIDEYNLRLYKNLEDLLINTHNKPINDTTEPYDKNLLEINLSI